MRRVGKHIACAGMAVMLSASVALSGCAGAHTAASAGEGTAGEESVGKEMEAGAGSTQEPLTETAFLFDTVISLTAYCDQEVMDEVLRRCEYFEDHFSRTKEGSDVWRINEANGAPVTVAPETAEVIEEGLAYGQRTEGLFDITIGAVSSLWDFKEGIRPADAEIQAALPHVDYTRVTVTNDVVQLEDPDAKLDLGGIAKGYIADDLAQLFREHGCESAIINLGGNVYVVGAKPDGSPWNVGVQDPNAPTDAGVIAVRPSTDTSVVTSGLYERFFEEDGMRYHHILDPRTGYPVETDLLSVSIATPSSVEGDVLATWMFLLGYDAALEYLNEQGKMEGLVMDLDGAITTTEGSGFTLK